MVFKRFVEIGRVILINYGPLKNKLAVVVDVLTTNRILIDGPHIRRQELSLNRVTLTDLKIDIVRSAKHKDVIDGYKKKKIDEEFKKTTFAKKLAIRQKRHNLTDFERFKVMRLRQKRAVLRHKALSKKKQAQPEKKEDKKEDKPKEKRQKQPQEKTYKKSKTEAK